MQTSVFSENVYPGFMNALKTNCFQTDEDKKLALGTAKFIKKMNDLFDNFNTGQLYSRNPNQQVVSETTDTLGSLMDANHWIATWRSSGSHKTPYCFKGFQQTLLGVQLMWEYLKSNEQNYLLLAHLNTDVAENVFSMVRSNRGSYERNASAWRFIRNLKQIMFQHLLSAERSGYADADAEPLLSIGNYEDPMDIKLAAEKKQYKMKVPIEDHLLETPLKSSLDDRNEQIDTDKANKDMVAKKLQKAAAVYYAGFAAAKLKKTLKCEACSQNMINEDEIREQTLLTELRAYSSITTPSQFGKLTVPSVVFENVVQNLQSMFNANISEKQISEHIVETWLDQIMEEEGTYLPIGCGSEHRKIIGRFLLRGLIIFTARKKKIRS